MKNVALHNLGCKVNSYEIDVVQQMLLEKGYKIVPFDELADIYIINTCTVTNIADRKSRQMLHKAKKQNPNAIVVAMGCYVQTGGEKVEMDPAIDLAIGNNCKKDIVNILESFIAERKENETRINQSKENESKENASRIIDINHTSEYEEMQLKTTLEHTRAYIKIQDGCNQFCSYCIIPFARGRVRSRKAEDIIKEVRGLAKTGYKEVVLTGIHISSYGVDFDEKFGLLHLIKEIHNIDGVERIRLGSLEPRIVTEEFAKELAQLPKVCPHFHLSLQSGCDKTLKAMNRRYDTSEFYNMVCILRNYYKNPAITTDVIVGFPGETEEDFEETKAFLQKVNFYEMHIFPYSKREGTNAAKMEGQLTEAVKKQRAKELSLMNEKQYNAYLNGFIGQEIEVLFEETKTIDGETYSVGHTKEYLKVLSENVESPNQIVKGIPMKLYKDMLML